MKKRLKQLKGKKPRQKSEVDQKRLKKLHNFVYIDLDSLKGVANDTYAYLKLPLFLYQAECERRIWHLNLY
jgi:hypothetical protein